MVANVTEWLILGAVAAHVTWWRSSWFESATLALDIDGDVTSVTAQRRPAIEGDSAVCRRCDGWASCHCNNRRRQSLRAETALHFSIRTWFYVLICLLSGIFFFFFFFFFFEFSSGRWSVPAVSSTGCWMFCHFWLTWFCNFKSISC